MKSIVLFLVFSFFCTFSHATAIFSWFPNFSVFSLRVANAIPPAGPYASGAKVITAVVDPDPSTIYSGRFNLNYDPSQLQFIPVAGQSYGWLGDWGNDPSATPAPPLPENPEQFVYADTLEPDLQAPNSGLTSSVETSASGSIVVEFDWGDLGFESDEPYNFFAINFALLDNSLRPVAVPNGTFGAALSMGLSSATPDTSAPNYAICQPQSQVGEREFCSTDQRFPDFALVPEPSTVALLTTALLGLLWRKGKLRAGVLLRHSF
ncbi:PEP-CTERM sorting domain-containing protein [Marinobacter fonticola]|uniref:PEP-CTERM sorting domain-containing protein n=1 Tax=Marinobacter fonticola TaxID=2603215 RepID=UPI0011E833E9|nr:PEP-CTERM sorting domain-containing protein [Marinobacter fonticola]